MFFNAKIIIIGVIIGVLAVGGAGYLYFSKIRSKTAQKESITKVTGGPTGKVEVLGRTGSEESKFPPPLAELEKKIEQIKLRGYGASEPEAPKQPKSAEDIALEKEKAVEAPKPAEIKVFPGTTVVSPSTVYKPSILPPNQFSSREEFKKEAEKYYSDTYIKSLVLMQDALISAGHLKESKRTPLKNENDVRDFWRNFANFILSQANLSSLPQEERNIIENVKEIDVSRIVQDFSGYAGGGSVIPVGTAVAESIADRLEFSSDSDFTEEELVKHFYPTFYLGRLLSSQEEMIATGFIKPEERVSLKTRKEVEWLMLKEIDYFKSKGAISGEESKRLKDDVVNALPNIQQLELGELRRYFQSRSSSERDNELGILANVDFLHQIGSLISTFFSVLTAEAAEVIGGSSSGAPEKLIDPCEAIGGFSIFTVYSPDFQLGIGSIKIGGPMVVETGEDCWRSLIHDADPYGACDWRACLYWGPPVKVPAIFKGKTNWGCDTIPPGQCYIPGPGYFFPTRCCSCIRADACALAEPPFVGATAVPWGCHVLCPLNLIWDSFARICGCGI